MNVVRLAIGVIGPLSWRSVCKDLLLKLVPLNPLFSGLEVD
jgi:hypothetical protein